METGILGKILLNGFNLTNFDILLKKIIGFTHDNGRNIVSSIKVLGFQSFLCSIHTLQLAIKESLEESEDIQSLINYVKRIITHFNHSENSRIYLKNARIKLELEKKKVNQ